MTSDQKIAIERLTETTMSLNQYADEALKLGVQVSFTAEKRSYVVGPHICEVVKVSFRL